MQYEVIVGNIGTVYTGSNEAKAIRTFHDYVATANTEGNRASGECVTLMTDSEITVQRSSTL